MADCFITRRGGGGSGGLNFEVVGGTTQPTSPKENTIWVNTSTPITGWVFSAEEPESPVDGMVWFYSGLNGSVQFNALKRNSIQVNPINTKQYIGGMWVNVDAVIYQDGEWVEWEFYLYASGNEFADKTGGWIGVGIKPNSSFAGNAHTPTVTKKTDTISYTESSNHSGGIATSRKIDFTPYKTLVARVKTTAESRIGVMESITGYSEDSPAVIKFTNVDFQNITLDISGLAGEYHIAIYTFASIDVTTTMEYMYLN